VNNRNERRFWPCRDGEVKRKGEGEEMVGRRAPSPPHGLVRARSSRKDNMRLGSLGGLEPSKPSKL
jgi:hypothetical protein